MKLEQEVKCDLPGMEDVTVTYNLMATGRQVDAFRDEANAETAKPVIVKISELTDPFSEDQPIAWALWLRWHGWRKALGQFLTDPN